MNQTVFILFFSKKGAERAHACSALSSKSNQDLVHYFFFLVAFFAFFLVAIIFSPPEFFDANSADKLGAFFLRKKKM
jgi:hypothetical protein